MKENYSIDSLMVGGPPSRHAFNRFLWPCRQYLTFPVKLTLEPAPRKRRNGIENFHPLFPWPIPGSLGLALPLTALSRLALLICKIGRRERHAVIVQEPQKSCSILTRKVTLPEVTQQSSQSRTDELGEGLGREAINWEGCWGVGSKP